MRVRAIKIPKPFFSTVRSRSKRAPNAVRLAAAAERIGLEGGVVFVIVVVVISRVTPFP